MSSQYIIPVSGLNGIGEGAFSTGVFFTGRADRIYNQAASELAYTYCEERQDIPC